MTVPPAPAGPTDAGVREQLRSLVRRGPLWPWTDPSSWGAGVPREGLRPAAVLVLLGALDARPATHRSPAVPADVDVLLVRRSADLRHHAGQVAFPGGRLDPGDAGPEAAAVREAVEETGLRPDGVEVLGTLGSLPVPVSRHLVTPVLAWWRTPSAVGVVDVAESATVFRAPVADLVDPARRGCVVVRHAGARHRTPAFLLDTEVVWGFTALVLDRLLDELGWSEPWDRTREVPLPG